MTEQRSLVPVPGESLRLVTVDHPFRRTERRVEIVAWRRGITVSDLVASHVPAGIRVKVFLNGREISPVDWLAAYPLPGQQLLVVPELGGGDGAKGIFRIIFQIAIVAASIITGQLYGTWAALAVMAGGTLVSALLLPASAAASASDTSLDSQAYSWSPQNTEQQGVVVPRWYGTNKVCGNIIASFIDSQNDDQFLNALVCLGLGPVKRLRDFRINDQPVKNYDSVTIRTRRGELDQSAIAGFKNTKVEYPASVLLEYDTPYTYFTVGNDFDALEVDITFPKGLWNGTGSSLTDLEIDLEAKIRKVGSTDWQFFSEPRTGYNKVFVSTPRWSLGKSVNPGPDPDWVGVESVWFELEAGSSNPDDHQEGETTDMKTWWHWIGENGGEYIATANDEYYSNVDKVSVSGKQTDPKRVTLSYLLPEGGQGQYEVSLTRLTEKKTPEEKYGQDVYFTGVAEILSDAFRYPRQVLVGVKARATDQLSGSITFSCLCDGAIVQVWDGTGGGGGPDKVHTDGSSATVTTTGNAFADLCPGAEIIANGQSRRVIAKTDANTATVHDKVNWDNAGAGFSFAWRNWTPAFSNNPAWVAFDILTQPLLSGSGTAAAPYLVRRFDGMDPARIDAVKFREWADYCDELVSDGTGTDFDESVAYAVDDRVRWDDGRIYRCIRATSVPSPDPQNASCWAVTSEGLEKRITFNGGFDSDSTLLEAVARVLQVGRAAPVWNGTDFTVAIDKPSDPVNLYTVGNIEESKFKETFLPLEERATEIEVDYVDGDDTWERTKLTAYRPDIAQSTGYRASIELPGITKQSEAWRAAMYRLMCNKYLVRTVSIDLDIEAINANIGDVVHIQHDVPQWGEGGRIVSATAGGVTLDKAVTVVSGLSYKVIVRLSDDTLAERMITNAPGTSAVLTVAVPFNPVPRQYDLYAFGRVDRITKPFRVIEIKKSMDQKCSLSCIEYRPEVYQYEAKAPNPKSAEQTMLMALQPKSVALSEISVRSVNGIVEKGIAVDFEPSADVRYKCSEVWYRKDGTNGRKSEWMFAGTCTGTSHQIVGVDRKTRYAVALLPVNRSSRKLFIGYAALSYITISGVVRVADLLYSSGANADELEPAEAGATVGAVNGINLRSNAGSVLNDSDVVTAQGTSLDTSQVSGRPSGLMAGAWSGHFLEEFERDPAPNWTAKQGTGGAAITYPLNGVSGGKVANITGSCWREFRHNIPYDPSKLYRIRCRVRLRVKDTVNPGRNVFCAGLAGIGADGTTYVNTGGANQYSGQHYPIVKDMQNVAIDEWQVYTAYFRDQGAPFQNAVNPAFPTPLHANVRYFRPLFIANGDSGGTGTMELDHISIDIIPENADLVPESTTRKWAGETGATVGARVGTDLRRADGSTLVTEADLLLDSLLARSITLQPGGRFISAASPNPRIEISDTLIAGYRDATAKEFYLQASDGRAYAGGGEVILDSDGMTIIASSGYQSPNSIKWVGQFHPNQVFGEVYSYVDGDLDNCLAVVNYGKTRNARLNVFARAETAGKQAQATISAESHTGPAVRVQLRADDNSALISLLGNVTVRGNVGIGTDSPLTALHVAGDITLPDRFAIGNGASACALYDIAIGSGAVANGASYYSSVALGRLASATGRDATAVGSASLASGQWSTAFGREAAAAGLNSVAIGYKASSGDRAVAIGYAARATGLWSIALGAENTTAAFQNSVALGVSAVATEGNQFMIGSPAYNLNIVLNGSKIHRGDDTGFLRVCGATDVTKGGGIVAYARDSALTPGNLHLNFGGYDSTGAILFRFIGSAGTFVNKLGLDGSGNLVLGGGAFPSAGTNAFAVKSGTAPSNRLADGFLLYAADQVAGNACPHVLTENGAVLKFFQQAHVADIDATELTTLAGSSGTAGSAVADVGTVFNQTILNDNFRALRDELNRHRTVVSDLRGKLDHVLAVLENTGFLAAS